MSRSRYYAQLKTGTTKRQREDRALFAAIKTAFDTSGQTYGAGLWPDCLCTNRQRRHSAISYQSPPENYERLFLKRAA